MSNRGHPERVEVYFLCQTARVPLNYGAVVAHSTTLINIYGFLQVSKCIVSFEMSLFHPTLFYIKKKPTPFLLLKFKESNDDNNPWGRITHSHIMLVKQSKSSHRDIPYNKETV